MKKKEPCKFQFRVSKYFDGEYRKHPKNWAILKLRLHKSFKTGTYIYIYIYMYTSKKYF